MTLSLGGRGYLFDERAAAHVVERIRAVFSAGSEHPQAARAGLLAELITEDAKAPTEAAEPYELGSDDVAILSVALHHHSHDDKDLQQLVNALRRYRSESVPQD